MQICPLSLHSQSATLPHSRSRPTRSTQGTYIATSYPTKSASTPRLWCVSLKDTTKIQNRPTPLYKLLPPLPRFLPSHTGSFRTWCRYGPLPMNGTGPHSSPSIGILQGESSKEGISYRASRNRTNPSQPPSYRIHILLTPPSRKSVPGLYQQPKLWYSPSLLLPQILYSNYPPPSSRS